MKMRHMLIEGFCEGIELENKYPCAGTLKMGIHCFECSKFSYTYSPNEIAISDDHGMVEEFIGFGGNMEPMDKDRRDEYITFWKNECKEKINAAYEDYIDKMN